MVGALLARERPGTVNNNLFKISYQFFQLFEWVVCMSSIRMIEMDDRDINQR